MNILYGFIISCVLLGVNVQSQKACNKCLSNNIYCEGRDVYYCMNDEKVPELIKTCKSTQFCSNTENFECIPSSMSINDEYCNPSSDKCGTACTEGQKFICRSATEFSVCIGTTASPTKRVCPEDAYCSLELLGMGGKSICAPQSVLDYFHLEPSCGEAEPPKPGDTTALQKQCWNAKTNGQSNRYFFIPKEADSTCKNYIYCEILADGNMAAVAYTCSSGLNFVPSQQACAINYVCPTS